MTKIDELRQWMKQHSFVSSAMIHDYATRNYYLSAGRKVRLMAERGEIERLNWAQKTAYGLMNSTDKEIAWYRVL